MFFVSYKSDDPLFDRAPVDLYEEQLKGEVSKSRGEISRIEILKWSGSFFNMVTFFIELSSGNKKNIIIKLFEPSERRKYVCGLKSADIVAGTISASVFALVLRYMQNQYSYRNFIF